MISIIDHIQFIPPFILETGGGGGGDEPGATYVRQVGGRARARFGIGSIKFHSWLLAAILALTVGGCSAVQSIEKSATRIGDLAVNTKTVLQEAVDTGEVGPEAAPLVEQAISNQDKVLGEVANIHHQLPKVKDKLPLWAEITMWISATLLVLGVLALLLYLGVGKVVRPLFQLAGSFIPAPINARAKFDAEAVEQGSACNLHQQGIAVERASNKTYDRAFRYHQRRIRENSSSYT